MHLTKIALSTGVFGMLLFVGGARAIAQDLTTEEAVSPEALEIQPQPETLSAPNEAEATPSVSQSLECPPGQFPSAFSDVLPFHWAYEAVNNLASVPMQCFDLPDNVR